MEFTKDDYIKLAEKHQEALVHVAWSPVLSDMVAVYHGDRGSTPQRAVQREWFEKKPQEFIEKMISLEREHDRKIASLAKHSGMRQDAPQRPRKVQDDPEDEEEPEASEGICERFLKERPWEKQE